MDGLSAEKRVGIAQQTHHQQLAEVKDVRRPLQEHVATKPEQPLSDSFSADEKKHLQDLAKKVDEISEGNTNIQFRFDDDSGRTIIEVKSSKSGEVIRTIPSEEVLRIAQNIEDYIDIKNDKGLAIDDKF